MVVVYDIEVLSNYFLYCDLNIDTKEISSFEISVFKNDLKELLIHLGKVKGQIGYNNLRYDSQIIQWIISSKKDIQDMSSDELTSWIYEKSQDTIQKANNNEWPEFHEKDLSIKQLDLLKVWHYDNKARICALKWIQYSIDWHNIEEMPINHWEKVNDENTCNSIKEYCINDVLSTNEFYNITKGKTDFSLYKGIDKIQLRKDIQSEFGFNCINFSDVKIGDEINKINYTKSTGLSWYEVRDLPKKSKRFTFGDCIPNYISFESDELNAFLNRVKILYINPDAKQEFKFKFKQTEYTFAKGGLHSNDKPRIIEPTINQILRDADVGSMYPNGIRKRRLYPSHLGEPWLNGYANIINKRIEAKGLFKTTKDLKYQSIAEAFKLALNGGSFGKTNEKSNWQYDPFVTFCVTIGCQFELMMLIEMLELSGIRVISANTDGIVCLFDKDKESMYYEVCHKWERIVGNEGKNNGELEYADYRLLAQTAVNDYIAIKIDGTPKHKGDFMVDFEIHKNKSNRIIPLALEAFYSKGMNPKLFILQHDNIFDFCRGIRAKGEWYFETRTVEKGEYKVEKLQKTNRYYISNSGKKLIKCHPDGREIQGDSGKWLCTIYNKHIKKDIKEYDINYSFYIEKVYDIINNMQPEIINENYTQLSFF